MDDKSLETTKTVATLSATGAGVGLAVAATVGAPILASALIGASLITGIAGILAAKQKK